MTDRPKIVMPLMHEIQGLRICIGEVVVENDTITWRFRGSDGERILEAVRDDLLEIARGSGSYLFDLSQPLKPLH